MVLGFGAGKGWEFIVYSIPIPLTKDFVLMPLISLPFFMLPCALLKVADIGIPSSAK
jgi:hypothetical protein